MSSSRRRRSPSPPPPMASSPDPPPPMPSSPDPPPPMLRPPPIPLLASSIIISPPPPMTRLPSIPQLTSPPPPITRPSSQHSTTNQGRPSLLRRAPYAFPLPDGRSYPVYKDAYGNRFIMYGGQTRRVFDVYNEVASQPTPRNDTGILAVGWFMALAVAQLLHRMYRAQRRDVFTVRPTGLHVKYFVRVDNQGLIHIYPDRGGPFRSSEEAQEAIDAYHVVGRQNLCMDGLSSEERSVRYALYWPHDGTRKNSAEAFAAMATRRPAEDVLKALLDKYNEDNRLGDLAYELKAIKSYKPCFDGKGCAYRSYSHLNMTMKNRRAENELFFAEITCMVDEDEEYMLTCICTVGPDDNGVCHVCGDDVKHPSDAEYKRGRFKPDIRCCRHGDASDLYEEYVTVRGEAWLKAEEARVREGINKKFEFNSTQVSRMFKSEAIKADIIGDDGHRKSSKYVVPARRK